MLPNDHLRNDFFQTYHPNEHLYLQKSSPEKKKMLKVYAFNAGNNRYKRKDSNEEANSNNNANFKFFKPSKKEEKIYCISDKKSSANKEEKNVSEEKNSLLLLQISQLVENKKKKNNIEDNNRVNVNKSELNLIENKNNNCLNINVNKSAPISFKHINSNPFKMTEITSIKNRTFDKEKIAEPVDYFTVLTHEYSNSTNSVKEYSYNENMNKDNRNVMQDLHKIVDKYLSEPNRILFTLYDGHGNSIKNSLKYSANRYPEILGKTLQKYHFDTKKAIINSFNYLDKELKEKYYSELENSGSTLTLIYIDNNTFSCANVGDSMAILIKKDGTFEELTESHKCLNNKEELNRIIKKGGLIFNQRLFGQLALTRAIGDFSFKQNGLENTPSYKERSINEDDLYIIIASDGVWDVLGYKEISQICLNENSGNADEIGKKIIETSINNGSSDNISCIVIKLN